MWLTASSSSLLMAPMSMVNPPPIVRSAVSFPTTETVAFIQPEFLGKPAANRANPGGAGNAEGNWWTPSKVDPKDTKAKVEEIKRRQAISEENSRYKVEALERSEKRQEALIAKKAQQQAELEAKRAKYAQKR